MNNTSTKKMALVALASTIVIAAINFLLLQPGISVQSWTCTALNLCWTGGLVWLYRKSIGKPVRQLQERMNATAIHTVEVKGNELEQAALLIDKLAEENTKAISFISLIGKGELEQAATIFTEKDNKSLLASALMDMRNQLMEVAEKEKERNWATEGLAAFAEILRVHNDSLPNLCNAIVARLVKYIGANQAAVFILNEEEQQQPFLELLACYAYDRKKFLHKQVAIGEGLLGQTFLEKETVYMTDIPQNYTTIRSGLGDATPTSLLIVPLKVNEQVLGVLELASFKEIRLYQREFIEKMSEGLAASIANAKSTERTNRLLIESQVQAQELRAQEEEMRQNVEELKATQEQSIRMQEELQKKQEAHLLQIEELNQLKAMMLEQEAKLKQSHEKSQQRSLMFKGKMETLDIELEGKNAQIKMLQKKLNAIQENYNIHNEY